MSTPHTHCSLVSLGVTLVVASCAYDASETTGVTSTTGATVTNNSPVARIMRARCRRAAECNRLGPGQMYADRAECMLEVREAAVEVVASCPAGVDDKLLDRCVDMLENQYCDADMGPVTVMPECRSYCAR